MKKQVLQPVLRAGLRPTFQQVRQAARGIDGHLITRQEIAKLSGLSLGEVYIIDIGGWSSERNIQAVLRIFNALTGQRLTSSDIR